MNFSSERGGGKEGVERGGEGGGEREGGRGEEEKKEEEAEERDPHSSLKSYQEAAMEDPES